jgi:hypothetical protein
MHDLFCVSITQVPNSRAYLRLWVYCGGWPGQWLLCASVRDCCWGVGSSSFFSIPQLTQIILTTMTANPTNAIYLLKPTEQTNSKSSTSALEMESSHESNEPQNANKWWSKHCPVHLLKSVNENSKFCLKHESYDPTDSTNPINSNKPTNRSNSTETYKPKQLNKRCCLNVLLIFPQPRFRCLEEGIRVLFVNVTRAGKPTATQVLILCKCCSCKCCLFLCKHC